MTSKLFLSAATIVLLSPAALLAGGLPVVCLPVNGVTADNTKACAKLIRDALGDTAGKVELRENDQQWYALFSANAGEVDLGKIDAALKAGKFSIPHDRLRLFGRMTLEIEVGAAAEAKLLADLKGLKNLTVEETAGAKNVLLVTVAAPYPRHFGHEVEEFGKESFAKERFGAGNSDLGPRAVPPAAPRDLPSYAGVQAVIEKHDGKLKASRFKLLGCSVQGFIAVSDAKPK